LLRERIADLLSREKNIAKVVQAPSYSKFQTAMVETVPDLVLAGYFEFTKFCEYTGISISGLYPNANILLYTDEDGQMDRIKVGHLDKQRVFDVRRVQQEVKKFLKERNSGNKATKAKKGG
jgi:hypothetical protein